MLPLTALVCLALIVLSTAAANAARSSASRAAGGIVGKGALNGLLMRVSGSRIDTSKGICGWAARFYGNGPSLTADVLRQPAALAVPTTATTRIVFLGVTHAHRVGGWYVDLALGLDGSVGQGPTATWLSLEQPGPRMVKCPRVSHPAPLGAPLAVDIWGGRRCVEGDPAACPTLVGRAWLKPSFDLMSGRWSVLIAFGSPNFRT